MKNNLSILLFILFFVVSCGQFNFVYKDPVNLISPIYGKTNFSISGNEKTNIKRYLIQYLGESSDPQFFLDLTVTEKKTKRSVQVNQAIAKLDYSLELSYYLTNNTINCPVYSKNITSRFSYVPKSSGYNYGSDQSLTKLYELAYKKNLEDFMRFVSESNISNCINEN